MPTDELSASDKARLSVLVTEGTRDELERLAATNDRSLSAEVRRALAEHLKNER